MGLKSFFATLKQKFAKFFRFGNFKKPKGKKTPRRESYDDYFDLKILGVRKDATDREIRENYLKKSLEHHPDRHFHATPEERKRHEEEFKSVNNAYKAVIEFRQNRKYKCKPKNQKGKRSQSDRNANTTEVASRVN